MCVGQNIQQQNPLNGYPAYVQTQNVNTPPICPQGYAPVRQYNIPSQYPAPGQQPMQVQQPQIPMQPQLQPGTQNLQVPSTAAGVNIQIFNPSVTTPGSQAPTYNVNAPCYPSSYYTGTVGPDGKMHPNGNNDSGASANNDNSTTNTTNITNKETVTNEESKKKTEKRKIVELTDEYIMNLENHLNSGEKGVRLNAAKEVVARLNEDESRFDDKALTALINKMLQDPSEEIRLIALAALEERIVNGDDYTVNVLKQIQQTNGGYGQDAIDATNILLKMSARQVEKEFEVHDYDKKTKTKDDKKA